MIKNNIRDYATAAFRYWAGLGCPTYEDYVARIQERAARKSDGASKEAAMAFVAEEMERRKAGLLDIRACEEAFVALRENGKECVCGAVKAVYMAFPRGKLSRGELTGRVVRFAMENYYSERQVYRFLEEACEVFAKKRGLRGEDDTD